MPATPTGEGRMVTDYAPGSHFRRREEPYHGTIVHSARVADTRSSERINALAPSSHRSQRHGASGLSRKTSLPSIGTTSDRSTHSGVSVSGLGSTATRSDCTHIAATDVLPFR